MADTNGGDISALYCIEQLKETNWFPWKMKVEAILDERGLNGYIDGQKQRPDDTSPLVAERERWDNEDKRARTIIKLLVHDSQAIHCAGAKTASALWKQLEAINKPCRAEILRWRKKLYTSHAKENTDIPKHLKSMQEIYETLHIMGDNGITDQEFKIVLMTSLPKSWEKFLTIYTEPGSSSIANDISLYELYAILIKENRRRKWYHSAYTCCMYILLICGILVTLSSSLSMYFCC